MNLMNDITTFKLGFAGIFSGVNKYYKLEIYPYGINLISKKERVFVDYSELQDVKVSSGFLFRSLELHLNDSTSVHLKGLLKIGTSTLEQTILRGKSQFFYTQKRLEENTNLLIEMDKWLKDRRHGSHWVSNHEIERLKNRLVTLAPIFKIPPTSLTKDKELQNILEGLPSSAEKIEAFRNESNEQFIQFELKESKEYLDNIEANPLTEAQRKAVISHENRTLVIAGAGSGKTSVIVAKAGYLLKKGLCRPEQLLLIAFNKSAAIEIQERIKKRIGIDIRATTFHELGLSIIAQVTEKKPSLSTSATDHKKLQEDIHVILSILLHSRKHNRAIKKYFKGYLTEYKSESDFKVPGDYYDYVQRQELRTIRGELVKSMEELEIANSLFINGVDYNYEKPYEFETATKEHRQYEPDFYLPDYDIYLEHFGINRDGSTAPFVNREEYQAGMKWKRLIHEKYNTTLIETYSYQKREGNLSESLEMLLKDHGVEFRPLTPIETEKLLSRNSHMNSFIDLVACFLKHFKGNRLSALDVDHLATYREINTPRLKAFMGVFIPIYEKYEQGLEQSHSIDFEDMINKAASLVEEDQFFSPYTNILVDEFQDIAQGRAQLISALVKQNPSHRLFCVGDDWQSIYRFAGSDISLMRNFQSLFSYTNTIYLDRTFRFNNQIERVASRFILENPNQIPKEIIASKQESKCRVFIHFPMLDHDRLIDDALSIIEKEKKNASVLILGRFNRMGDEINWQKIQSYHTDLSIEFKTVHSSKGMEADYVLIYGIDKGKYGFPSEIVDDPILETVLSEPESYNHAEERRLFYVALTRAKKAVHLLSATESSSPFLKELIEDDYNVGVFGRPSPKASNCPVCISGEMILHSGPYGNFYSCSHYPLCDTKAEVCPTCQIGYLVPEKGIFHCNNKDCDYSARQCPECKTGKLVVRKGKNGVFWGCSNYGKGGCDYTERYKKP